MEQIRSQADVDTGLVKLLETDTSLTPLAEIAGQLPLRLQEPGFPGMARIIIGQQVSRASASAIHQRFVKKVSPQSAEAFLAAGEAVWIEIGLSRAKQAALSGLSYAIVEGRLDLGSLTGMPAEVVIAELTTLKGIGPWSAEVYLLFCAGHPDLFPAGDLALREAVGKGLGLGERPSEKEVREIAERWSPYRGIAARLFWAYYSYIKDGKGAFPV